MDILNKKILNKKIIVFAAHPDDTEFYAGGTISKLSKINKVYLVLATNGEKGLKNKLKKNIDKCKIRVTEQLKAVKIMGIKFVDFMELKYINLNTVNIRKAGEQKRNNI